MKILWHRGVTRTVILTKRLAFKIPSVAYGWKFFLYGFLANMQEVEWSGFDKRLCPIRFAIPYGVLVVMPRCSELSTDEFIAESGQVYSRWRAACDCSTGEVRSYDLPVEMKPSSFGRLNGELVAFDYGGCGRDGSTTQSRSMEVAA